MTAIPSSYECVVLSLTGQLLDVCTEESVPMFMNSFIPMHPDIGSDTLLLHIQSYIVMARLIARADSGRRLHSRRTPCHLTPRTVREKYGEETADKRGSQRWWWKGDRRRDGKAVRREDGRQVDRKKTTEEADRGDGSQRSERWSKGYKTRHAEAMKRADQRRAKRPRCETTEADPKKPTGDVHRDYKAVLLAMIRQIGVGELRKQLGEVEMGYNPAKEKRQDDASRELSRSKEKRQEEANAIEGREENDPPEQELTETETAYEVSEPPEASNTKELANIEAATRARQDARLRVPVQQDNGNGRVGIGMPLYLVGASKELRENAEKRESDLKNKENDEKQEEKRNKHAAEVKARAARAMEKHVTTSPPKSAASEQGCRCDAVDDIETPAGFCLNTQNQSVWKPAPTAPVSSEAAGSSQCTRIAHVPAALQAVMTSALAPPLATPEALSTPQTAVTLHGATAEKATKEETAATTKTEETSALGAAKNEAGNVNEPSAWNRRVLRRKGRPKRQAKEKLHVRRESSVEDSSQRRHQPLDIAMRIYNGVGTTTEMIEK